MAKLFANSGEPDQMPHSAASYLGPLFASYPFTDLLTTMVKQNVGTRSTRRMEILGH